MNSTEPYRSPRLDTVRLPLVRARGHGCSPCPWQDPSLLLGVGVAPPSPLTEANLDSDTLTTTLTGDITSAALSVTPTLEVPLSRGNLALDKAPAAPTPTGGSTGW